MIKDVQANLREEEKKADLLTDEYRHELAAKLTPDRSVQMLAISSPHDLGLNSTLALRAINHLGTFCTTDDNHSWRGSFEEGLMGIRYTGSKTTANAIAAAIGDLAPHKITVRTSSGRVSKREDPSSKHQNVEYVKGSGCTGRDGMDSTETLQTKHSKGSSGMADDDDDDDNEEEAYDDEFLGPSKALHLRHK